MEKSVYYVFHGSIDIVLCIFYSIFIWNMGRSTNEQFRTPYYILTYSTGVSGIILILSGWMYRSLKIIPMVKSASFAIHVVEHDVQELIQIVFFSIIFVHFNGQILMLVIRFCTLFKLTRHVESNWTRRRTIVLIFIQYALPLMAHCSPLILDEIEYSEPDHNERIYYLGLFTDTRGTVYGDLLVPIHTVYALILITLNILCLFQFRKLKKVRVEMVNLTTSLVDIQRTLITHGVSFSSIAILFVLHQIAMCFVVDYDLDAMEFYFRIMFMTCLDLLVFANPLLLLFLSKFVREELREQLGFKRRSSHTSTDIAKSSTA